jgi:hypothetical protein
VEPEGLPFEPNLTIEAQGSPLQVSPLTNPQKNFIILELGAGSSWVRHPGAAGKPRPVTGYMQV